MKLALFREATEKKDRIEQETAMIREKVTGSHDVLLERFVKDLNEGWIHSAELHYPKRAVEELVGFQRLP
ncbi:hypothetical protein ACP8HI_08940 [Paenibacillus sp. FA6]|uniref:hypothetical protein n=1 Tax=Paenibacillus sp. FA6 TaxID=3413029 RepID=UPI003F655921